MTSTSSMTLSRGRVVARIRISEGGVVDELRIDGRSALARTPWSAVVVPAAEAATSDFSPRKISTAAASGWPRESRLTM